MSYLEPFRGQGRSKRRGEEERTALRVGRSPLEWILVNDKPLQYFRPPKSSLQP